MSEEIDYRSLKMPNFIPKTNLDEYINSTANINIYHTLKNLATDDDSILEYFNNLYNEFYLILENIEKPTVVLKHLINLDLDKDEFFFNLQDLIIVITYSKEYIQQSFRGKLNIILDLIKDEIFELGEELYPEVYGDGIERNFRRIQSYSNSDEDFQAQLIKLNNIRTGLQQNSIMYGHNTNNEKYIRILNYEISNLENLIRYFGVKNENSNLPDKDDIISEEIKVNKLTETKGKATPNYSELLTALSKYITGISALEFAYIIDHHSIKPGTLKASWIGKMVDAHRFATYINLKIADANKCFSFPNGKKLKDNHKDKLNKASHIIDILKAHINK